MELSEQVVHLYCFPPAGVSAAMFATWPSFMPSGVKVLGLNRPGRFVGPLRGAVVTSHALLADMLAAGVADDIGHAPAQRPSVRYACLGLGEGAALAFSVAARVEHLTGFSPVRCFVGHGRAPHDARPGVAHLTHRALLSAFVRDPGAFGACPDLQDPVACTLPLLRADLVADEGACIDENLAIDAPLVVLGGRDASSEWARYSSQGVRTYPMPSPTDGDGLAQQLRDVTSRVMAELCEGRLSPRPPRKEGAVAPLSAPALRSGMLSG